MTINEWLISSSKSLEKKSISSARLDCLIILEHVLKTDRVKILAQLDSELTINQNFVLRKYLQNRKKLIPIAYLTNNVEFYGRDFYVDKRVLIPRPESELIVEITKYLIANLQNKTLIDKTSNLPKIEYIYIKKYLDQHLKDSLIKVADIGTGSGNLGISITLESPSTMVDLIDISKKALQVAQINVDKYSTNNFIIQNNLLKNITPNYDIIVANLPYVPDDFPVSKSTKHEPKKAIFSGNDGLSHYKALFKQLNTADKKPLYIIIEKLPILNTKLNDIASNSNYKSFFTSDYVNVYQLIL